MIEISLLTTQIEQGAVLLVLLPNKRHQRKQILPGQGCHLPQLPRWSAAVQLNQPCFQTQAGPNVKTGETRHI